MGKELAKYNNPIIVFKTVIDLRRNPDKLIEYERTYNQVYMLVFYEEHYRCFGGRKTRGFRANSVEAIKLKAGGLAQ